MGDSLERNPVIRELVLLSGDIQLGQHHTLLCAQRPNVQNWEGGVQQVEEHQELSFLQRLGSEANLESKPSYMSESCR